MTVPYTFANQTGTIPLSELDANFSSVGNNVATANTVTANAQPNITSVGTLTTLSVLGNINVGNVTANYFIGNGSLLTGIEIGNFTYSNANVAAYLPINPTIISIQANAANTNSNVSNLTTSVTGINSRLGNLTTSVNGITSNLANTNSNVANLTTSVTGITISLGNLTTSVNGITANLANTNSNVANLTTSVTGINSNVISLTSDTANMFVAVNSNVANTNANVSNIGNAVTSLSGNVYANANVAAYLPTSTYISSIIGNVSTLQGQVTSLTGEVYANANVAAYLPIYNGSVGVANVNFSNAFGLPTIDGSNNKINLYENGPAAFDYAIGMSVGNIWLSVPGGGSGGFNFYDGNSLAARIGSNGNITASYFIGDGSQLTNLPGGGNYSNANVASFLANYGSNTITTTGNITAGYFLGNGSQLTGITTSANTANTGFVANSIYNINGPILENADLTNGATAALILPTNGDSNAVQINNLYGNITLKASSTGGGGLQTWNFDGTGNLNLPTNGAVNFAGGSIKQTLNEDFYIRASDDESDGFSIYNVVDDGADNILSQTRLEYNQYSITTDAQGAFPYTWLFRESGQLDLPGDIAGNVGGNLTIKIVDQAGSDTFIDLQTRSHTGDALISNIRIANPNVTISTATNAYNWEFDNTGNLTLPQGGVVYETNIPFGGLEGNTIALKPSGGANTDQQLLVYPTAGADFNHLHLTTGNLWNTEMFLGNDDFYVKLANTGNIVINANDNIGNTAQWTFGTEGTILNSGNLTLQTPNGVPGAVTAITGSSGSWEANPSTNLATTGGTGTGLTVNVIQEGGYADTITIATPGDGYTNGDAISVVSGSSSASFTISVLANGWTFDTTGNLTLPGNTFAVNYANGTQVNISGGGSANTGNVTFNNQIILGTGSNDGGGGLYLAPGNASIANSAVQYLRVRGGDFPTHIHLDTGNNAYYDQYFGADNKFVKLEANGNIVINADDSAANSATWTFDTTGVVALPTISLGAGVDEQTTIQSQRKIIPPFRWSAEITADTPTVVYTATSVNTTSMKVTTQVQHSGFGFELFEVFATYTGSTDTYYVVNNRVAPPTIAPTTAEVSLTVDNVMQITLTINSGAGSSWVTYDAVEFGIPND